LGAIRRIARSLQLALQLLPVVFEAGTEPSVHLQGNVLVHQTPGVGVFGQASVEIVEIVSEGFHVVKDAVQERYGERDGISGPDLRRVRTIDGRRDVVAFGEVEDHDAVFICLLFCDHLARGAQDLDRRILEGWPSRRGDPDRRFDGLGGTRKKQQQQRGERDAPHLPDLLI